MILRKLLFLAFFVGIGWVIRRLMNAAGRAAARQSGSDRDRRAMAPATRMVRDQVCNTFLPESSAFVAHRGGRQHYFCSERCKRQFLEGAAVAPTPAS